MANWIFPVLLLILAGFLAWLKIPVWWIPMVFAFVLIVLPLDNRGKK